MLINAIIRYVVIFNYNIISKLFGGYLVTMNLEENVHVDIDRINEIDMRINELEKLKVNKFNDLNKAEEKLAELRQRRELLITLVENFKNDPDIKRLYINRNASLGRVSLNLKRLKTLQQMTISGVSKVERKDISLPYSDDLGAKIAANTKMVGLGLLVFMAFRKGNLLEVISSLGLSLYLGSKVEKSKEYISVDRAYAECERKLSTAREQFYTAEGKVTKLEELIRLFNEVYSSDELLYYIDEWTKTVFEIKDLISQIDNEILVLLKEKTLLENVPVNAEVNINTNDDKVRKIGLFKPADTSKDEL